MARRAKLLRCYGIIFVVALGSFNLLHSMGAAEKSGSVMLSDYERFELGKSQLFDLLSGRDIPNICEPYNHFHTLLAMPGEQARNTRVSAARMLGCMCQIKLAVPKDEEGLQGAQKYFALAVNEGSVEACNDLAYCATEACDYVRTVRLLRQGRFFEVSHDCLALASQVGTQDQQAHDKSIVGVAQYAIKLGSLLPEDIRQQRPYWEAISDLVKALEKPAERGNGEACCLLARLYAFLPDNGSRLGYVTRWLSPLLSTSSDEQVSALVSSTKADDALKLIAQNGDARASAPLGIALYKQQKYDEAYVYCRKAADEGDSNAHCYCIHMMIHGWGTKKSLAGAAREIQKLSRTIAGRQSLSVFAHLCNAETRDILAGAIAKKDEYARLILGMIMYENHEDDVRTFNYLSTLSDCNNTYASYCCAQMLAQGRGTAKAIDRAARMYGAVLADCSIDEDIRARCTQSLREIAQWGNVAGLCEFIVAALYDAVSMQEFRYDIDLVFEKSIHEFQEYVKYLQGQVPNKLLMKAKKEGNPRAFLVLGKLQAAQAFAFKDIDKKIQTFQAALELLREAYRRGAATEFDVIDIVLCLGAEYKNKGLFDKAKEYFGFAAEQGNMDGKSAFAQVVIKDKKSSAHEIILAFKYLEESALGGDSAHQCLLAKLYQVDCGSDAARVVINADISKAYIYAKMFLEHNPEDIEGRLIMGNLLAIYQGKYGIPANQQAQAYKLLSSVIDKMDNVKPSDYYVLGRLSFANGKYAQAMSWFNQAGNSPSCTCYRGLIMLIEAEKGNKQYTKGQAYDCIERALSAARTNSLSKQIGFSELFRHDLLIRVLRKDAESGDLRARTILARIVYLFPDEALGLSKQMALAYLLEAAQAGVAFAQSYLGFIHYHAQETARYDRVALEYFMAASRAKDMADFVRDEIVDELCAMARETTISPTSITAAYYALPLVLREVTQDSVRRAIYLINKAEGDLVNTVTQNKSLVPVIYDSGAWAALRSVADKGDADIAATLGLVSMLRFLKGLADFNQLETEGLVLLDNALRNGNTIIGAAEVAKKYMSCVTYAFAHHLVSSARLCMLLERARQLDPANQDIVYTLSVFYRQSDGSANKQDESFAKGMAILTELADKGLEQAVFEMGLNYLACYTQGHERSDELKGIQYLNNAARKGNQHALCIMVSLLSKEQEVVARRIKKDVLAIIALQLTKADLSEENKVLMLGLKAVVHHSWKEAIAYFEKLTDKCSSAQLLIEVAMLLVPLKGGLQTSGPLLLRAVDLVGSQHIGIRHNGMEMMLRAMLRDLDDAAHTDPALGILAGELRAKLKSYNYTM